MRSHPLPVPALALALAVGSVAGCSLTGLDRFQWPTCEECDQLNARDGYDPRVSCEVWQCTADGTELCRLGPRDFDQDTFIAAECGGDDCNDFEAVVRPGAEEACNGLDDDCNDLIDDGSRTPEDAITILSISATPRWASYQSIGDAISMTYDTDPGAGIEVIRSTSPITSGSVALEIESTVGPDFEIGDTATAPGCASPTVAAFPLPRCGAGDTCGAGEICVTSVGGDRLCGTPISGTPPPGTCNTDVECEDGNFCNGVESCQPSSPFSDSFGCRPMVATACTGDEVCVEEGRLCRGLGASLTPCAIAEVAVAPADDEWLAAAVSTGGCGAGSLRAGYFGTTPRSPESRFPSVGTIAIRGDRDGVLSASWTGIDVSGSTRCPGPDSGRAAGSPEGVSGPVIATLPSTATRRRPQGLVAYLAAPICRSRGACADPLPPGAEGPVDVEVVGLWLEEGMGGGVDIGWVNASGSGTPSRLGVRTSASATRPQLLSWSAAGDGDGYVLAYPLEGGGVGVHVMPPIVDPAPVCDATLSVRPCIFDAPPYVTQYGSDARTTPELVIPSAQTLFATADITGDVAVAMHGAPTEPGAPLRFAFAWVEDARIAIAQATLDPGTMTMTAGAVEHVTASDAQHLTLAYVARGMVGDVLADGTASDPALRGGFVATWTEPEPDRGDLRQHVWAARYSDAAGAVVAPGAVRLTLDAPPIPDRRLVARPYAFVDEDGLPRVVGHVDEALVVFPSICGTAR